VGSRRQSVRVPAAMSSSSGTVGSWELGRDGRGFQERRLVPPAGGLPELMLVMRVLPFAPAS
jgi:hypothetical protein